MKTRHNDYINIFFTINDFYAKYLSVCMVSILLNTKSPVSFYIIDGGISQESKRKLEYLKKLHDFKIEYLSIEKKLFEKMPKSSQMHISNETNYRFLISSLKNDIDKCIFLDADLILEGDIKELWYTDIGDFYMAAVTDQAPHAPDSWSKKLPLPTDYVYVNTGVTVMNLKKWREENIEKKLFENLEKFKDLLLFPDQDTLNITLCEHVKTLSHRFNAMPVQYYWKKEEEEEAFADSLIIHWAGCYKPWVFPDCKMADMFFKYAKLSPFYEEILVGILDTKIKGAQVPPDASDLKHAIVNLAELPILIHKRNLYRIKLLFSFGQRRHRLKNKLVACEDQIKYIKRVCKSLAPHHVSNLSH